MTEPSDTLPPVGILMLESRFPRIPGDIGNRATWPFPVLYGVVPWASPERAVRGDAADLLPDFIAVGQRLVAEGAAGITTSCGFLAPMQAPLAEALGVPVAASALMQIPLIDQMLPSGQRCGVLTIAGSSLTPAHLAAAGAAPDTPIATTEGGREFTRAILGDEPNLDVDKARADVVAGALALTRAHPEVGAILLECTNMAPYAPDVRAATGLPVHSIVSFVSWFQAGLAPPRF